MRHQIKYKPETEQSSTPFFGSCLVFVLWAIATLSLTACSPQFKASVLSLENLVQDAELFAENTHETEPQALPPENGPVTPEEAPQNETSEAAPEAVEIPSGTAPATPPSEAPVQTSEPAPVEPAPVKTTEQTQQEAQEIKTEEVIVVTPTETNGGAWFYLTKEFSVQDVEIDEQQNATTVEKPQKIELMIEMKNFTQAAKENSSVETSISADLGLNRLVELKTNFTRNAPRRIFKRGRWHIQAECQFHPTENKCEMVNYLAHVKFSFDRKTNPPQPQVHLESALAFYALENSESVVHYKILPSSFRNFTELVTEMKSHANQGE
jgi:hypothetical protein